MSAPRPFGDGLCAAVRHYLHQNNKTHLGQINAEILADLAERYYAHHEAQTKARKKKGDATAEEMAIYDLYPRKVARGDALVAIRAAAQKVSLDLLAQRTAAFGRCVQRWPANYRYKEGRDLCPHPATWFNRESYLENEKEWMPAGMFTRDDDPRTEGGGRAQTTMQLNEPEGWKEEFPNSTFKDWKEVPTDSKKAICDHMNKVRA